MNSKTKNKSRLQKVKDDIKEYQKMNNDWFNEYKSLGGKKSKKKYFENLEIFFDETLQIWVYGNPEQHIQNNIILEEIQCMRLVK